MSDPAIFLAVAAIITALATAYGTRKSSRTSDRTVAIQAHAGEVTEADTIARNALAFATQLQTRLERVENALDEERRMRQGLQSRVNELEREREELLGLLDAMGAPRTPAQARRQRRADGAPE